MLKRMLLTCFMLVLLSSVCFAEDVYIGDSDGYAVYLRTESISFDQSEPTPGIATITITLKYQSIVVPKAEMLINIKKLYLDDTLSYFIDNYKFELKYNRVTEKFLDNPIITREKSALFDQNDILKRVNNKMENIIYSDTNNYAICIKTFSAAYEYVRKNEAPRKNPQDRSFKWVYSSNFKDVFIQMPTIEVEDAVIDEQKTILVTVCNRGYLTQKGKRNIIDIFKNPNLAEAEYETVKEQYDILAKKSCLLEIIYYDKNDNILLHKGRSNLTWEDIVSESFNDKIFKSIRDYIKK